MQALEVREHHGHQLQDDRGGDVRHDAQRENGEAAEIAAAEQIEDAENRAGGLAEELLEHRSVDARRGDVRANAVHRQQRQGEKDAVPQVFDAEHIFHGFEESVHAFFPVLRLLPTVSKIVLTRPILLKLPPQTCRPPW